jgi:hypothetical protein
MSDVTVSFGAQDDGLATALNDIRQAMGQVAATTLVAKQASDDLQASMAAVREHTAKAGAAVDDHATMQRKGAQAVASHNVVLHDFRDRLAESARELPVIGGHLSSFIGSVSGGQLAVGGLTIALGSLLVKGVEWSEHLNDIADRTGLTAGQVQVLTRAAVAAGVSGDGLTQSVETLNRVIGTALTDSTGQAAKRLADLGISMKEIKEAGVYERLQLVAAAISKIEDPSMRAASATEVFGKGSGKLLELLRDYPEAISQANSSMLFSAETISRMSQRTEEAQKHLGGFINGVKELGIVATGVAIGEINTRLELYSATLYGAMSLMSSATKTVAKEQEHAAEKAKDMAEANRLLSEKLDAERAHAAAESFRELAEEAAKAKQAVDGIREKLDAAATARKSPGDQEALRYQAEIDTLRKAQELKVDIGESYGAAEERISSEHNARMEEIRARDAQSQNDYAQSVFAAHREAFSRLQATMHDEQIAARGDMAVEDEQHQQRIATLKQSMADHLVSQSKGNEMIEQENQRHSDSMRSIAEQSREISDQGNLDAAQSNPDADPAVIREQQRHEAKLRQLDAYEKRMGQTTVAGKKAREQEDATHLRKTEQNDFASRQRQLGYASQMFGNLATLMNSKNREMFQIGKAAAMAQAITDTYAGATKAYAQLGVWGFPVAASIVVAGLANVANIASTEFGGSSGGGGGGGASPLAGAGTGATPLGPQSGGGGPGGGGGRRIVVNLTGSRFSRQDVEELVRQINEAGGDGSDQVTSG